MCKNQSNNGFDCQCANIGSCFCDPIGSGKPKAHKWADVIKAYAEGRAIDWKYTDEIIKEKGLPSWRTSRDLVGINDPCLEWRVKPTYPTLSEIAQQAFYDRLTNDPYQPGPGSRERWKNVAKAMKKAIASGEYAEASGEYSQA